MFNKSGIFIFREIYENWSLIKLQKNNENKFSFINVDSKTEI
jgi:hypothetical protein